MTGTDGSTVRFAPDEDEGVGPFFYLGYSNVLEQHVLLDYACFDCDAPRVTVLVPPSAPSEFVRLGNEPIINADGRFFIESGPEHPFEGGGWGPPFVGIQLYRMEGGRPHLAYDLSLDPAAYDTDAPPVRYPQSWGAEACWTGPRSFTFVERTLRRQPSNWEPERLPTMGERTVRVTVEETQLVLDGTNRISFAGLEAVSPVPSSIPAPSGDAAPSGSAADADGTGGPLTSFVEQSQTLRIMRPSTWRALETRSQVEGGGRATSIIIAPPSAERVELDGYLSEGVRVTLNRPPAGRQWSLNQGTWAESAIRGALAANAGFALTRSSVVEVAGFRANAYEIVGENENVSEPEKSVIYYIVQPSFLLTIELVSPASKLSVNGSLLLALANTLQVSIH